MTKDQYDEQKRVNKGGKPKEPTHEDWRGAERERELWRALKTSYLKAGISPYYFEEEMWFADHCFDAPEEPKVESDEERRERIKEMDRRATEHQIAAFGKFAREAKKTEG